MALIIDIVTASLGVQNMAHLSHHAYLFREVSVVGN